MTDNYAVKLATDYLDYCFKEDRQATLVEMLAYADAHGKLILSRDEVNEAVNQRPVVSVERRNGRILFSSRGTEHGITPQDHEENCKAYRKEFWEKFEQMQTIRPVRGDDAVAICDIYNHYVIETPITFEEDAVTPDEMRQRILETTKTHPWLVCEEDGKLIGYSYATKWRTRVAYRHSVEATVYLLPSAARKGRGSALLASLLAKLRLRQFHCVIGGVALPNEPSVALLEKFAFHKVAHFKEVGYKFGRWIDVGYWQLMI